jgi:hypothetical protein
MTEYRVVDGIASTPKGQQLYDQAVANQNARNLANKNHKVTPANVSNKPQSSPRGRTKYAIAQDLIDRGFPTVDGVPIPVKMEHLGQQQFIDIWRCELDGSKATSSDPKATLGYFSDRNNRNWVVKKKGVDVGDCYYKRVDSRGNDCPNCRYYRINHSFSNPPQDYRATGQGIERQFYGSWIRTGARVGGSSADWVIKRQQIYSDITGETTYKLQNGKKVKSTTPYWKKQIKITEPEKVISPPIPEPVIIEETETNDYPIAIIMGILAVVIIIILRGKKNA